MDPFEKRHPQIILYYYVLVVLLLVLVGHPFLYLLTFVIMFMVRLFQIGIKRSVRSFAFCLSAIAFCLVLNPLLNHRGVTLLMKIGDIRITKEAALYGVHMSLLLLASLFLFSCFSEHMKAEKIMALTGKRFPSFSLLFSMILRTVPKVRKDYLEMTKLHGNGPKVWSAIFGVMMEQSVEQSIAIKQKGFGNKNRTSYWHSPFVWQDYGMLIVIVGMICYLIWHVFCGTFSVRYFPSIYIKPLANWQWCVYILFIGIPIWLRGKEECKWFWWKRRITNSIIHNSQNMQ